LLQALALVAFDRTARHGRTNPQIHDSAESLIDKCPAPSQHTVNGETTSRNNDKRPMGFRLWKVDAENGLRHEFVKLEGLPGKK